jgi:hypothetical protein
LPGKKGKDVVNDTHLKILVKKKIGAFQKSYFSEGCGMR